MVLNPAQKQLFSDYIDLNVRFSVDFAKVFEFVVGIGNDGVGAGFPTSRTNLAVMIRILECLDQSKGFIDGSTNWEVVHRYLPQIPFSVDDEKASESVTGIFEINAVVFRDLVRQIGEKGNIERAQTAVLPGSFDPSQVGELRVDGNAHNFRIDSTELVRAITERDNLRGTDEGEVQGIEEENEIFSLVHI